MEVLIPPEFVPGVHDVLARLAQRYTLGIVSDTIHTSGRGIRNLLEGQQILQYFKVFQFSDEVGASKPSPVVFQRAAAAFSVPLPEIVHIGDRESNDVDGPLGLGMQCVLFTGVLDRGSANTRASATCREFTQLPDVLQQLDR
jgi:putative hydrolase of the HAD superfamily